MRIRPLATITVAALAGSLASTTAAPASTGPTHAQIAAAVRRAEKSPDLWATVNECNIPSSQPKGYRRIGVRVQMPALGFSTRLYMAVQIEYFSETQKRFLKTGSLYGPQSFGVAIHSPRQSGVSVDFAPPAAGSHFLLRGVATLEWRIGTKVLGRVVRNTGHGYRHVDFSKPPGYNAATCKITA